MNPQTNTATILDQAKANLDSSNELNLSLITSKSTELKGGQNVHFLSTRDFNYDKGGVGPAHYTPNVTSGKAHQYTMNKTKRDDLISKDRMFSMKSVPGVGQYNLTPKTWEGPKVNYF